MRLLPTVPYYLVYSLGQAVSKTMCVRESVCVYMRVCESVNVFFPKLPSNGGLSPVCSLPSLSAGRIGALHTTTAQSRPVAHGHYCKNCTKKTQAGQNRPTREQNETHALSHFQMIRFRKMAREFQSLLMFKVQYFI